MRELWIATCVLCLITFFAACSDTSTVECGGTICPTSKVCHLPLEICVDSEQLQTCRGLQDGEDCEFPGALNGKCLGEICHDTVCGNGDVDYGEACDDGNTESGDNCSADCRSDETCGNGSVDLPREQCDDGNFVDGDGCQATCLFARCGDEIVDPEEICDDGNLASGDGCNQICSSNETCGNAFVDFEQGEQCDDGGFLSQDGCTSVCTAELPLWTEKSLGAGNGRRLSRMVFHAARESLGVYGGTGPIGEPANFLQELRSEQWIALVGQVAPPPRKEQVFVYDNARRVAVAFGGVLPIAQVLGDPTPMQTPYGDTWELSTEGWKLIPTATSPSARRGASGAYDATRRHIVVFGGNDGSAVVADTWIYDGTWTQVASAGPTAREGHLMAYDHSRDRVVMFGGTDANGNELNDTWEWNGVAWSEVVSAVIGSSARGTMAYLPGTGVVAFGGLDVANDNTWIFNGTIWSEVSGEAPPARYGGAMEFDPTRAALILYGGGPSNTLRNIWSFDGVRWEILEQVFSPAQREAALFSHDSLRRQTLYYGGRREGSVFGDLWEWNGEGYVEVHDIGEPATTSSPSAFLFDEGRGCHLMIRPGVSEMETFVLCGVVWTRLDAVNAPPARAQSSIAYDSIRNRVVLFGGNDNDGLFNDTWELQGDTWTQLLLNTAPSARTNGMFQLHEAAGVMVLFGGRGVNNRLNDTWTYDGSVWREVPSLEQPSPRFGPGMIYNAPRSRIMVHGGEPGPIQDSWEFDGAIWTEVAEPRRPAPRPFPAIGFDSTRKRVVFAGSTPFDTWEFSYSANNEVEICAGNIDEDDDGLTDCSDPDCEEARCGPGARLCRGGSCICAKSTETLCGDDFDGDCDGLVDCSDPDCGASADCMAEVDCTDGLDDDSDGRIDCADIGCHGVGACEEYESLCEDGLDNDGDGRVDCQDLDCFLLPCEGVLL